jgi:hypothetical protein
MHVIDTSAISTRAVIARVSREDTVSLLLVSGITLLALLLGLLVRNSAESGTRTYKDPALNATVHYPDTWQLNNATKGVVSVRHATAARFPTTFELRKTTVDQAATDTAVLSSVANDLAGTRARQSTGYKLFNITPRESIKGLPAAKASYVYVDMPAGALLQSVPSVVMGTDYLVRKGSAVYTFSLLAADGNQDEAKTLFDKFVESAELP